MNEENKTAGDAPTQNTSQSNQSNQTQTPNAGTNTIMGVLSYLGPLVIVSYLVSKDVPFVKFHIKQGLVIFAVEIVLWILGGSMYSPLWMLFNLINLGAIVLSIIGIVNVVQGKEKELPLVGQFSSYFKF